jgi:hypothetical protein
MLRETEEERQLRKLVEWIAARGGRVTVRELQRANSRRWPTRDLAESALQDVVRAEVGRWEEGPVPEAGGHQPRQLVLLHPTSDTRSDDGQDIRSRVSDTRPEPLQPCSASPRISADSVGTCGATPDDGVERVSEVSDVGNERTRVGPAPTGNRVSDASVGQPSDQEQRGDPASVPFVLVLDVADLPAVGTAIDNSVRVGVDVETTGQNPRSDCIRLLSLACDTIEGGTFTYLIDCQAVKPAALWEILQEKELILHNAALALAFLAKMGFIPSDPVHDTLLLSQVLYAGRQDLRHRLEDCAQRDLGRTIDTTEQSSNGSAPLTAARLAHAACKAATVRELYDALRPKIESVGLTQTASIETRCLPGLCWLGQAGMPFDKNAWMALAQQAQAEVEALSRELDALAPHGVVIRRAALLAVRGIGPLPTRCWKRSRRPTVT